MEGWCLEVELRPGSQHSQNGFVDFINLVISSAKDSDQATAPSSRRRRQRCSRDTGSFGKC
jgi:hypothetical protein